MFLVEDRENTSAQFQYKHKFSNANEMFLSLVFLRKTLKQIINFNQSNKKTLMSYN